MDKRQAKKNEKRQQENALHEANKKAEEKEVKEEKKIEKPKKAEPEKQLEKTTIYSMSAIIYTLVSAAVVVISMIVWIKPGYYYLDSMIGKTIGDDYYLDMAYEMGYAVAIPKIVGVLFVIIGALFIVNTLLSILMVSKTMKAANKPYPLVSILCFLLTAATIVLFFIATQDLKDAFVDCQIETIYEVQKSFTLYNGMMIAVIANTAVAFVHMIMTFISKNIWKKTGKVR